MLKGWTIGRASGCGAIAGLAALILWQLYAVMQAPVRLPFIAALMITAGCGVSILWITLADLARHRRRGERVQPIRIFDVAMALLFLAPSLLALDDLLG